MLCGRNVVANQVKDHHQTKSGLSTVAWLEWVSLACFLWANHLLPGTLGFAWRVCSGRWQLHRQPFYLAPMRLNRWRQEYESHFSSDLRIPHSDQCAQALQCPPSQQKQNLWTVYQFTQTAARSEALDSLTVAHSARPSKQTNPFVPK